MLRCRISSALEDLNRLSAIHDWIPNEHTIRPTSADLAAKHAAMDRISNTWPSVIAFIEHSIFCNDTTRQWFFKPSTFRYNLPNYCNHYVLWSSQNNYYHSYTDEDINNQINTQLKNLLANNNYDFVWYKNPKPTVIDFWHVQVFWIMT
jgi:hypothetical protein